jgi:hypothetical protein
MSLFRKLLKLSSLLDTLLLKQPVSTAAITKTHSMRRAVIPDNNENPYTE